MKTLETKNNTELMIDNYGQYFVFVNFTNGSSSICLYAGTSKNKAYKIFNSK